MKNNILSLAVLFLLSVAFTACEKDPSFNDQLVGHWLSVEIKAGSEDLTATFSYDLHMESSKEFDLDIVTNTLVGPVTQTYTGNWSTDAVKQEVSLTYDGSGDTNTWDITAISDNALTAELVQNNVRYTVKFEKQ